MTKSQALATSIAAPVAWVLCGIAGYLYDPPAGLLLGMAVPVGLLAIVMSGRVLYEELKP